MGNFVPREGLFTRLDGTPGRTVIWLSGPPGSGKSTLAAGYIQSRNYVAAWYQVEPDDADLATFFHYLIHSARKITSAKLPAFDPKNSENIEPYSRRFFRQLFSAVPGPVALVLDNFPELPAQAPLRVALEAGLTQVPRHCCVIVTCRSDPPATLARMRATGTLVTMGANDLRLSTAELMEIAALRGQPVTVEAAEELQEKTQGWAAAIVLMLEHVKITGGISHPPHEAPPRVVFDYLAGEVFDHFEPATQEFLLRVACVKRMTIEIAEKLGGNSKANRLLLNFTHNDYFIHEVIAAHGRVYQIHPLLREFLIHRAEAELPDAVSREARCRAARLLREAGLVEDAIALLIESEAWTEVAAVASELTEELVTQGRGNTLLGWLDMLPDEILESSPQLLLAEGLCQLQMSPRTARHRFEESHRLFRAHEDRDRMIQACCGILDATILEFDDLASVDKWRDELMSMLSADVPLTTACATTLIHANLLRDPSHPVPEEFLRIRSAPGDTRSVQVGILNDIARATIHLLQGNFAASEAITGGIDLPSVEPATHVVLNLARALHHILDGDFQNAQKACQEGLKIAEAEGIQTCLAWLHMLASASALGLGEREAARCEIRLLEGFNLRRGDRAVIHFLRGWMADGEGESGQAQRELASSLMLAEEAGLIWMEWIARIALAQARSLAGDSRGATTQARAAATLSDRLGSPLLKVATLMTGASLSLQEGDEETALRTLREACSLGGQHGFRHMVGLRQRTVGELCALALRHGIESDFIRALIRSEKLAPPPSALRLKQWPWSYYIGTLRGFQLTRGQEPIEFSAKGPGRPVELLKVLIAHGGQNVRADQLADALWPHMDADYAHKSFTQTLHRLRNYFDEDALILRDGRLSLNSSLFWVDTWALEHVISEIDTRLREPDAPSGKERFRLLMQEILDIYVGPFLPDESEQLSYIACREQIRARVLRILNRVARIWEERGGLDDAIVDCYLRCIDVDTQCEPFYRNLMQVYERLGEAAEALAVYERLRTVLAARQKTEPSPETQDIFTRLRNP
jgi:ATP/maltotriose-dependent transcriptional regulator MalT/DNA-binding SARP family transcriptional activator